MLLNAMKRELCKEVLSLSSRNAIDKDSVCRLWDSDEEFKTLNDWWPTVSMVQQAALVSLRLEYGKSLEQAIFIAEKSISLHAHYSPDDKNESLKHLGGAFVCAILLDKLLNGEQLPVPNEDSKLDYSAIGKMCLETYGNAVWGSKIFEIWFVTGNERG